MHTFVSYRHLPLRDYLWQLLNQKRRSEVVVCGSYNSPPLRFDAVQTIRLYPIKLNMYMCVNIRTYMHT
jgi:hypothetical protein